ncbi:MAG: YqeG family HAD IIIA-type phosphatase [Thermoactinomyces sp.]
MLKILIPDLFVQSIYDIDFVELKEQGIKAVIVDLDNTLVETTCSNATPELVQWLNGVKKLGLRVMIVSNNTRTRVSRFAAPLNIPYIHAAKKPLTSAFRRALKELGCSRNETVVIGDQLLTDVLGGNRMGLYTILVVPVSEVDGFFTRVNRKMERFVFRLLERKGLIPWDQR